ncbi:LacI family DNA-binding transcriptional regulator, partial [Sinorhizobium medicae]|uniref:LacI family DNA-binding transcriptional regulator n=1 Tax=Sinorhizobium medicae TaxID=110321 RepID=UPI001F3E34A8
MGKERVTVVDIARAAGVSKSTVSLVLQGSPLVNEATRAKVNAAIRELRKETVREIVDDDADDLRSRL